METSQHLIREHVVDGKLYQLRLGVGITQLVTDFENMLKHRYRLVMFYANEEERTIKVGFMRELMPQDESTVYAHNAVEWTLSSEDYDDFERDLGIPVIKPALLDGLLKYALGLPKYFNPDDDNVSTEMDNKNSNPA